MIKTYVLDANAPIRAPYAVNCFEENYTVLPIVVPEELDNLKKAGEERGVNVRASIRMLGQLRMRGNLLEGATLRSRGTLRVGKNYVDVELSPDLLEKKADNRILKVCRGLTEQQDTGEPEREKSPQAILMTEDILLRIKAQVIGIRAGDSITEQVSDRDKQYTGCYEVFVLEEDVKELKKKGIPVGKAYISDESGGHSCSQLWEGQFLFLKADQSIRGMLLRRAQGNRIVPPEYRKSKSYGISPKNSGQYFLREALMQPADKTSLVIAKGMAGTAKTFYSLAVGLEKLLNDPTGGYHRITTSRPNAQFDADIGFLPRDEQEKISPLTKPIIGNLEQLIDPNEEKRYEDETKLKGKVGGIFDRGLIQIKALNYIRDRSIIKTYLIIDEAQNITPNQVKGIVTKAGVGIKIALLGDPNQIDRAFLDEHISRFSYASKHMKGNGLC